MFHIITDISTVLSAFVPFTPITPAYRPCVGTLHAVISSLCFRLENIILPIIQTRIDNIHMYKHAMIRKASAKSSLPFPKTYDRCRQHDRTEDKSSPFRSVRLVHKPANITNNEQLLYIIAIPSLIGC